MKRTITLWLALFTICVASAQTKTVSDSLEKLYKSKNREIIFSPISLAVSGFEVGFGKVSPTGRLTRGVLAYFVSENSSFYPDENEVGNRKEFRNFEAVRIELQHLFLRFNERESRFAVGGFVNFKSGGIDVTNTITSGTVQVKETYRASAQAVTLGFLVGVRAYVFDDFFFESLLGGGITFPTSGSHIDDLDEPILSPYNKSINLRGCLNLGYTF